MPTVIFLKLLAIFVIVVIGWVVGKLKWLGEGDVARTLSNAAYYIFVPALLFRTTARIDLAAMPWGTLVAVFVPLVAMQLVVYAGQRLRRSRAGVATAVATAVPTAVPTALPPAAPAVRAISAVFGNSVQVGIPVAAALFGEAGLAIHLTIVSLHALVLLTLATAIVEIDVARAHHQSGGEVSLAATLLRTARNSIIHPVVLPVLLGLVWNLAGPALPAAADETLLTLGAAVVPLCLVLIGMSLAYYGVQGALVPALGTTLLKLLVAPALVLVVAHWGFALRGTPLAVVVMLAALPIGSNALIFAQRYRALEAETTAAIVVSTLGFAATAPGWLLLLQRLG